MCQYSGMIFDMDNTLLKSNIDFAGMKLETYHYLREQGILQDGMNLSGHTTSTLIEAAIQSRKLLKHQEKQMWSIPEAYEIKGMSNAPLEPGAEELLELLRNEGIILAVVTNNAHAAATTALEANGIAHNFDIIVGREQMQALKPSPSGYEYVLKQLRTSLSDRWLSIGDSWVDGKASKLAGLPFLAYQADRGSMQQQDIHPIGYIRHLSEVLNFR